MPQEFEAKFLKIDPEKLREKLKERGFELVEPEHLMVRQTFRFPNISPEVKWARVRKEYKGVVITIKEVIGEGIEGMRETELKIEDDFEKAVEFLSQTGLERAAWQENKREKWERDSVEVTIDTWPGIEPFCEIEGRTKEEVERVAEDLGFDMKEAIFGSVAHIYSLLLKVPVETIVNLPEITFQNPPQKQLFS